MDEARETISGHGYAVLIIDDEEWILELAKAVLRNDGYQVVTALSGAKAIAALDLMNFDIIVTDWKMPGMSGMQFYEHLLDTNTALARRVLFMSGDVVNDVFNEFLKRHNRTCLTKPFELEEFRTAVAKVLKENKTE